MTLNNIMINSIFVGDVMPGKELIDEPLDISILNDFQKSDIVFGNLESPIVIEPPLKANLHKIPLWTTAKNTYALKKFHFTHLNMNNNHTFDLFEKGLDETIRIVNDSGIKVFGINYSLISQYNMIKKNGLRLGFFAINWIQPQFNGHLFDDLKKINIRNLKKNVDYLICFLHWGDDHNIYINREQQQTAKKLIDQGVDLIIGSHPHVPQGWEIYKGKYVFYSLGNFIFTPKESYDYLPYKAHYDNHRENILFERVESKIGLYIKIIFFKKNYNVVEIKPVYREHTLPRYLPKHLFFFYEDLEKRMNKQIENSHHKLNIAEKKRILISYTLPLILKHPIYWPMLIRKISFQKLFKFICPICSL
jgi:hypothetical protein